MEKKETGHEEQQQIAFDYFMLNIDDLKNRLQDQNILRGMAKALGFMVWVEIQEGNEQMVEEVEKIIRSEINNG